MLSKPSLKAIFILAVMPVLLIAGGPQARAGGPARYQPGPAPQGWQTEERGQWLVIPPWDEGEDTIVSIEVCAGSRVELPLTGDLQGFSEETIRTGAASDGVQATLFGSAGRVMLAVDGQRPGTYTLGPGQPPVPDLQVVVRVVDCDRKQPTAYTREADDPFPGVPRPGEAGYEEWLQEVAESLPGWDEMARSLEEDMKKPGSNDDTREAETYLDSYEALLKVERELMRLEKRQAFQMPRPGDPDYDAWLQELADDLPPVEQQIEELQRELGPRQATDDTSEAKAMLDSYQRLIEAEKEVSELARRAQPPGQLPTGWYQASEGGTTVASGHGALKGKQPPPKDTHYRPVPAGPPVPAWQKGGAGEWLELPRRGDNPGGDRIIMIRVCVGDTATVPLQGNLDDESLLPATPSMGGVDGSLERKAGRLVLSITPTEAGTHTGYLENSDGGLVKGLRLEIHARDCGKKVPGAPEGLGMPVTPAPGSAKAAGAPDEAGDNPAGAAAGAAESGPEPNKPSSEGKKDKGALGGVAKGVNDAARKVAGGTAGEGVGSAIRRGARGVVWPVSSETLAGMREGLMKVRDLSQKAIALHTWSESMRGKLPQSARIVSFTTIDDEGGEPDIGGITRINLAGLGVPEGERADTVVNFISVDESLRTEAEAACDVSTASNGDLVVDVPKGKKFGGILIQVGGALFAVLADTPRSSPLAVAASARPIGIADGEVDVAQGSLTGETVSGPAGMTDPARPVASHEVKLGGQELTPVAVRDGEVAVTGEQIAIPPNGDMDLTVTSPAGETFIGEADAWGYDVAVPEVTERGASVDVTLELNGVEPDESVSVTFYPQPGQEISPRAVTLTGVENGRSQPVARLTTDRLGPQGFGVDVRRTESTSPVTGDDR
jgi:hypothetical protein